MEFERNTPYIQKVYNTLKREIIFNHLMAGEVINERQLSEKMEISRTPLRDGLNLLENEGWIIKNGNKRIVSVISWKYVEEIYEVRNVLECYILGKIAKIITEEEIEDLEKLLQAIKIKSDSEEDRFDFLSADLDWHRAIWKIGGNARLTDQLIKLNEQFIRINLLTESYHDSIAMEEHEKMMNALRNHKPEEAEKACHEHLKSWVDNLSHNKDKFI